MKYFIIICILNTISKLIQIEPIISILNNKSYKGLDIEVSSTNLDISKLILVFAVPLEEILDSFNALTLFILLILEWVIPPNIPPAIITPTFSIGGILLFAIPLATAIAKPVIDTPNPILVPIVLIPWPIALPASLY